MAESKQAWSALSNAGFLCTSNGERVVRSKNEALQEVSSKFSMEHRRIVRPTVLQQHEGYPICVDGLSFQLEEFLTKQSIVQVAPQV